jgi:stage II sporulation protein D
MGEDDVLVRIFCCGLAALLRRALARPSTILVMLSAGLAVWLAGCAGRTPQPDPAPRPTPRPTAPGPEGPASRPPRASPPLTAPQSQRRESMTLRIETGRPGSGTVETVDLETYVRDVVVGELAVTTADAALAASAYQAQAIVARTYALAVRGRHAAAGFDLCSTTHCQVFVRDQWRRSRWAADVDAAVHHTRGQYLSNGSAAPIEAVFHAHCGGHTSAAAEVWRSAGAPYLLGVTDPYCLRDQPAQWSIAIDLETLRAALNQRPRTQVGDRLDGVQILRRDAGGRVVEVAVSGTRAPVVTGEDFRLAVLAAVGARSLRSARFEVERVGSQLRFTGRGSGHGVGLCQVGLIGRLRAGQSPAQALLAYYPGTRIVTLGGT